MNVHDYTRFSDLILALRKQRGLSQRAMAKALEVSPGYVGQWELRLSQPSNEVARTLCDVFGLQDVEYVQRLAYAERAPEWLRDSIVAGHQAAEQLLAHTGSERAILLAVRELPETMQAVLAQRVQAWVEGYRAASDAPQDANHRA